MNWVIFLLIIVINELTFDLICKSIYCSYWSVGLFYKGSGKGLYEKFTLIKKR